MLGNCGACIWVSIKSVSSSGYWYRTTAIEHTDETREEELVPCIVGLNNLDLSLLVAVCVICVGPTMARQERSEADIVLDTPVMSLDTAICRRHPKNTLVSIELWLIRSRVQARKVDECATIDGEGIFHGGSAACIQQCKHSDRKEGQPREHDANEWNELRYQYALPILINLSS